MGTLVNQAPAPIAPGTYDFGPFAVTPGVSMTATITPTTWPASGAVFSYSYKFLPSGNGGAASLNGAASAPTLKDGVTPGVKIQGVPQGGDTQLTVQVVVSQQFTAGINVTSP